MSETEQRPADAVEQTIRAAIAPRRRRGPVEQALLSGLLRRDDNRWVSGVCAAVARAVGLPVRLVRLEAFLLLLLGIGPALYLVATLLLPREVGEGQNPEIETPRSRADSGRGRVGDALALLAVLPALGLGLFWLFILYFSLPSLVGLLLVVAAVIALVLRLAAHRAQESRRAVILAGLAARAGLEDEDALREFLREQQSRAPWAFGGAVQQTGEGSVSQAEATSGDGAAPTGQHPAGQQPARRSFPGLGRHSADPRTHISSRTVSATFALMAVAVAAMLTVLNLDPGLAGSVAQGPLLPQLGRIAAGLGAASLVAAIVLIHQGLKGRYSVLLAAAATLTLVGTVGGTLWLRLTHDPQAEPVQIDASHMTYGEQRSCPQGLEAWRRPVVIDLRDLNEADAHRLRAQATEQAGNASGALSFVDCTQTAFPHATILMPKDPNLVSVDVISTLGADQHAGTTTGNSAVSVYVRSDLGETTIVDHADAVPLKPASEFDPGSPTGETPQPSDAGGAEGGADQ